MLPRFQNIAIVIDFQEVFILFTLFKKIALEDSRDLITLIIVSKQGSRLNSK